VQYRFWQFLTLISSFFVRNPGYSLHPNDKGGETNFGITAVYDAYRKTHGRSYALGQVEVD
jgi:lysozyme family protein